MKKDCKKYYLMGVGLLAAFALWTAMLYFEDVRAIGPRGSAVGFAAFNGFFHRLIGTDMLLYTITDWSGLVPVGVMLGFAVLGLIQWIKRKHIARVDRSILALGVFYLVLLGVYLLFEECVVNYRPVLIEGYLEASYPSSTTLLVLCVMPTALMQLNARIKNTICRRWVIFAIVGFTAFMVVGRLVSGVHWVTDIVGGALLSGGLVMLYRGVCLEEFRKD